MNDHMYMVLPPDIDNLEELEYWKSKFDSMTYYQRKVSNDISIDNFGSDNITRYNKLKTKLLDKIDPNINLGEISPEDTRLSLEDILRDLNESSSETPTLVVNDIEDKIIKVKKAESEGLIIMIDPDLGFSDDYPEDSISKLKDKWNKFQGLSYDKRQLSNDTAKDILGFDNYSLYDIILNKHIKRIDIEDSTPSDDNPEEDFDILDKARPYFTPYELGSDFKSADPITEAGGPYKWSRLLETLYVELNSTYDKNKIKHIKESIYELGWNPEIPFSLESACKVGIRHNSYNNISFIDLTESGVPAVEEIPNNATYENLKDKIVPVFVVLVAGNSLAGASIKWFTDSQWSHISIGFDSKLKTLYSFNFYIDEFKVTNGFSIEGKDLYLKQNRNMKIKTYCLFVTPEQKESMLEAIDWYIKNKNKTRYDFGNIFKITLRSNKDSNDKDKMICSQFVYSILKLANFKMKITKNNSKITPSDIDKLANDARFYCMYEGKLSEYNSNVIDNMIKKIIVTLPLEQFDIEENVEFKDLYNKAMMLLN